MEETIHINMGAYVNDTHYIVESKVRLWPALLSSLNWLRKNPIPGGYRIPDGISLMIINSLAISVEGFIADIVTEHLHTAELKQSHEVEKFDWKQWNYKRDLYNKLFRKKIEDYTQYKSIKTLLELRNNIAHGRTYSEVTTTDKITGEKSNLESPNEIYQNARDYFIENKLLTEKDTSSNAEVLWKIEIATFLFFEVKIFLFDLIQTNESKSKIAIEAELKTAYQV